MTTRRAALAGGLLGLLLTACGNGAPLNSTSQAAETLAQRPTFEAAEQDYLNLLRESRAAIASTSPQVTFSGEPVRANETLCKAPFDQVEGRRSGLYRIEGEGQGAITDAQWPTALAAVAAVATKHGFGAPQAIKDEPGDHVVAFYGPYDEELSFGTKVNTILGLYGACFLLAASHPAPK